MYCLWGTAIGRTYPYVEKFDDAGVIQRKYAFKNKHVR